jgi:hypothetical protein
MRFLDPPDVTARTDHEARKFAGRYYLKLGDIKSDQAGEGDEGPYAGWIRVASFRWSEKLIEDNSDDATYKGKIAPDRITFVSAVNKASAELLLRVAIGAIIKGPVQLDCVVWGHALVGTNAPVAKALMPAAMVGKLGVGRPGASHFLPVLRLEMGDAKVVSCELSGPSHLGILQTFTLVFDKLTFHYGQVQAGFDFAESKKI